MKNILNIPLNIPPNKTVLHPNENDKMTYLIQNNNMVVTIYVRDERM